MKDLSRSIVSASSSPCTDYYCPLLRYFPLLWPKPRTASLHITEAGVTTAARWHVHIVPGRSAAWWQLRMPAIPFSAASMIAARSFEVAWSTCPWVQHGRSVWCDPASCAYLWNDQGGRHVSAQHGWRQW